MNHLFLCREFPPTPYPAGGIGTYVVHITRLLAQAGDRVHVIGQRWEGAPKRIEYQCDERLIIHRIAADDADLYPSLMPPDIAQQEVRAMRNSRFPAQWFSWVAAGLAERLVEQKRIDVIEAQEWEAPLYYFILRRSLGLGPARTPPCITHVHSPTEFIFRSNDWSPSRPDFLPMKRMEDHVILSADALLCPSRFLAGQCLSHYGFADDAVTVIPLPMGDTVALTRSDAVWRSGLVLYVGRLEPRKGVIEFVEAALARAEAWPDARFAFVGADLPYTDDMNVGAYLEARIPTHLHDRFAFLPPRPRPDLFKLFSEARMAVVPSRWENFPNTALEALCTGLPVLATRNGGMAEMIVDNETGWLAADDERPLSTRLAEALERALSTSAADLRAMGARAATDIRGICDNDLILKRHRAFRQKLAATGAGSSVRPPTNLPWAESRTRLVPARHADANSTPIVVVILAFNEVDLKITLASLAAQDVAVKPVLVGRSNPAQSIDWIAYHGEHETTARQMALGHSVLATAGSVMFVRAGTRLQPGALAMLQDALARCSDAGIIVPWSDAAASLVGEMPAFPYQWAADQIGEVSLYRGEALRDALKLDPRAGSDWELGAAVMAAGWSALRYPAQIAVLAEEGHSPSEKRAWRRRRIAERHRDLVGHATPSLVLLLDGQASATSTTTMVGRDMELDTLLRLPLRRKLGVAVAAARQPLKSLRWLTWHLRARFWR